MREPRGFLLHNDGTSSGPDRAAWETEELFAEHRESLMRYLRYHLRDSSGAEDIAQESFIRFFQARSQDEVIEQPKAWLFRVAHNLVIDYGRKKKPDLLDEDGWRIIEANLAARNLVTENQVQIMSLPWHKLTPTELECLRLRAEGLKFREVAEVMDITISTVASYVARAVNKLRETQEGNASKETGETPQHGRTTAIRGI